MNSFPNWFSGSGDVVYKISYLELWQPSCSLSQNHSCNFEKGHHEEHSCEVIWNLDQWFKRRCLLKIFPIWSSGGPFCSVEWNHLCKFDGGYQEKQFCEIFSNLDQWFSRRCLVKKFLIWSSGSSPNHLCNLCKGHYEKQFCEFISYLGQWFRRRCCYKDFLSEALVALLFSGVEPFMQFWKRASWGTFMWSNMKFWPVAREEMSFKEKVYGRRTHDEPKPITIPHLEPLAQVS